MQLLRVDRKILIFIVYALMCSVGFANDDLFVHARELQREGKYDEAIDAYKDYLLQPMDAKDISKEQMKTYTDALMQLMNTFQSKGEPEACISALEEIFDSSPIIKEYYLRDFYSVMGYALSRTEKMKEAEKEKLEVLSIHCFIKSNRKATGCPGKRVTS